MNPFGLLHSDCSVLAQAISIACQDSPPQVILNDLPTSSLCSFESVTHFYLTFTLMAKLPFYYTHLSCYLPLWRPSKFPLLTAFLTLEFIVLYHFASNYLYKKKSPSNILCSRHTKLLFSASTIDDQICCIPYPLKFFKNQCKCHHQKKDFMG